MNIAIVGCGMIADAHVREIRKIDNVEVVAACDSEILMAEQLAERFQIPKAYSSMEEMFNECRVDVVHILTPPPSHFELACLAMENNCHVLMEKPFVVHAEEAAQLIDVAKAHNVKITVNHFHSFSPPQMKIKKMVKEGRLGFLTHIEAHYGYRMEGAVPQALLNDSKNWIYTLPGGVIQNNINHLLCTVIDIFPEQSFDVYPVGKTLGELAPKSLHQDVLDELRVLIVGKRATVSAVFSSNIEPRQHFMKIYGTKNILTADYETRALTFAPKSALPGPFGKLMDPFLSSLAYLRTGGANCVRFLKNDFYFYAGANLLFREFYSCIENDSSPPIPYDDILRITNLTESIFDNLNSPFALKSNSE